MIYFDYAASTPVHPEVISTYTKVLEDIYGNSDSIHRIGVESNKFYEQARDRIAEIFKVKGNEIIFTSGATESNNLAIRGTAFKHKNRGKHIITSKIEHSSVYNTCLQLKNEFGFDVDFIDVNNKGIVDIEQLKSKIRPDTILISIMAVNNETGAIQPINEIKKIVKQTRAYFHVDCVQLLGKMPFDFTDINFVSMSSHKIHGLKGSGILYIKENTSILPMSTGGIQEFNLRAGTSNVPSVIVLAKTLRLAYENMDKKNEYVGQLNNKLRTELSKLKNCHINSPDNASNYILNVSFVGIKSEIMITALGNEGYCVSGQSTCSSKLYKPSRILQAMNLKPEIVESAIRISLSSWVSEKDVDGLINAIKYICDIMIK